MTKIATIGSLPSVDSLQVRLPLSSVNSYADSLTENTFLVSETGEVIEERTTNRIHLSKDKTFSFKVGKVRHVGSENMPCLQIMTTSKILGRKYFDGINKDTFEIMYDAIQRAGLVNLDREVLLSKGVVTDLDIKVDAYLPDHVDFSHYTKHLERNCKKSAKLGEGCHRFNNQDKGYGIQFGTRETAKVNRPFLKVYNKELELLTRSLDFTREYLQNYDIKGLVRTEATVKNKQSFKRVFGTSDSSLGNLLSFSPQTLGKAIEHARNVHLSKVTKYQSRTVNDLSGQKLTIYNLMCSCLSSGMFLEDFLDIALAGQDKKGRQRTRSMVKDLFSRYQLESVNRENEANFGELLLGVK